MDANLRIAIHSPHNATHLRGGITLSVLQNMEFTKKSLIRVSRSGLEDAFRESHSIAAVLLFPYFLPLVAISICSIAWALVEPDRSSFLGISNDVIGLFIVTSLCFAAIAQVLAGIPLNFLLAWIRAPFLRGLLALTAVAISLIPFHGGPAGFKVAIGFVAIGAWISMRSFRPDRNHHAEQGIAPSDHDASQPQP